MLLGEICYNKVEISLPVMRGLFLLKQVNLLVEGNGAAHYAISADRGCTACMAQAPPPTT